MKANPSKNTPTPQMNFLGLIFFLLGAPNLYAFFQHGSGNTADNTTYSGGQVPQYAFVVLLAMAIAGIFELSVMNAA